MAKLGDRKDCRLGCGGKAELKLVEGQSGGFVGAGGAVPDTIPPYLAWECEDCEDREPFNGKLDD